MALMKGVKIEKMYVIIFPVVYMFDEIKQMNENRDVHIPKFISKNH